MNVEQLKKQAKELVRAAREGDAEAVARFGDLPVQLASAQLVLAREHGYPSWPALVRVEVEQPFHDDIEYYEGRADGIATVNDVTIAEARRDLAGRHGFSSWGALERHVASLASGEKPLPPFVLAYRALEAGDRRRIAALLDAQPELVELRGTNGNDLFGMANDIEITRLLLERGAEVNRGNDYGWTKLHQAGYGNDPALARLLLDAGARTDLYARGDGGTPLIAALFWGHREVAELLGLEPGNLRVAAGLGKYDMIDELVGTPAAGDHRAFYRPHGGFPAWTPSNDPQEILDEALVWAAKADRVEAIDRLVELGADVNQPTTFGGPGHGQDVFALHLAAQAGQEEAVDVLLELGADPTLRDGLYHGDAAGWAGHGCRPDLAERFG